MLNKVCGFDQYSNSDRWELFISLGFLLFLCRWLFDLDILQEFRVFFIHLFFLTTSFEKSFSIFQFFNCFINLFNWCRSKHFQRLELVLDCIWNIEGFLLLFLVLVFVLNLLYFLRGFFLYLRLFWLDQLHFVVFPVGIGSDHGTDIDCLFRRVFICLVCSVEVILDIFEILNKEIT